MNELAILRHELADTRAILGLSVPSVWGMNALRGHWPAWGEARIKRELRDRVGVIFGRGRTIEVSRADVLAIDRQIEDEAEFRRAGHVVRYCSPPPGWTSASPGDLTAHRRQLVARALGPVIRRGKRS